MPGRPRLEIEDDIVSVIEEAGIPLTAKMIVERLDGPARRTVYYYLDDMDLYEVEYPNVTAYSVEEVDV